MESYCLKCKILMILSKCVACGSKKPKFIKRQDAKGILVV